MAFKPQLEPDEIVTLHIIFRVTEKTAPFHFVVSNRAIFWPATKMFAMSDATYFKRIRNDEISEVHIRKMPPYGLWLAAAFMVLIGIVTAVALFVLMNEPGEHTVSGWPFALIVGGLLMPIATKGRLGLEIKTQKQVFRWKPPLVIGKAVKQKIQAVFDQIAVSCEKSGLRVTRTQ